MNPDRPTHKAYEQFKDKLFNTDHVVKTDKPIHPDISEWVKAELPLGTTLPPSCGRPMFFTISPPSNMKVECVVVSSKGKRKSCKSLFNKLSLQNQKVWIHRYFNLVYRPHLEKYFFIHEINESNNLHIHGILYDHDIKTEYDLRCFRDTINKHWRTLEIINNPKLFQRFNHIVFVEDIEHVQQYLSKDLYQSKHHFGYMHHLTYNVDLPRPFTKNFTEQDKLNKVHTLIPHINYEAVDSEADGCHSFGCESCGYDSEDST